MSCILAYNTGDIVFARATKNTFVCRDVDDKYGYFSRHHFGLIAGGPFGSSPLDRNGRLVKIPHSKKAKDIPIIGNVCIDCGEIPYWNFSLIKIMYPELYLTILERELAERNLTWGLPEDGFKNEPGLDFISPTPQSNEIWKE